MKFWIVNTFMLFAILLSSCQQDFEDESTVVLTEGVFDPIKVTINGRAASTNYNYGDYEKGRDAVPITYKITNNSKHPIKDINVSFEDPEITEFNFTVNDNSEFVFPGKNGTCGSSLASGSSCTIDIQFYSDKTQKYNQTITLSYDNAVYPNTIKTSFYVNSGDPAVLIYSDEKTIFKYGDLVGPSKIAVVERALAERQVKNLTIVNTGELTAKNILFEEDPSCTSSYTNDCPAGHQNAFEYVTSCSKTLAPGASCSLDMFFQPLNKDPEVGEIAEELKEVEYRTFLKTSYINGPRNNQSALQGSFSSLSTRIQANFAASSENLIFGTKVTVGNRLNQSFKITNVGYRSGHLNRINLYDMDTDIQVGVCEQADEDAMLECLQPDLSGNIDRSIEAFFIKDTNNCFSKTDEKVFIEVGQSCLFQVIFQPSTSLLQSENEHKIKLELVYDSLFQGNETVLVKDLINLQAESKSKAKLDVVEFQFGGETLQVDPDSTDLSIGYTLNLGRLAIESPIYYQRKKLLIRIRNTGATKAQNILVRDGRLDVIPSIVEPPFKVNLGTFKDDNKTFFKDVSKSDNCTNLPPNAVCTITMEFSPIGFSNDDNEIDSNFYDGTLNGDPRKIFYVSWDTQAIYTDDNIETEIDDFPLSSYFIFLDATLVRKAKMANFIDSHPDTVEWKGGSFLRYKGAPFVSGNEPEFTFVYRNIGTGPATYIYSPTETWSGTPKLVDENYELVATTDLASHGAQYDCLDIVDFNHNWTGETPTDSADALSRPDDWDPLPKEEACALTFKLRPSLHDWQTLAEGEKIENVLHTGLVWMSRGFDELGTDREKFHFGDDPFFIYAGLFYHDGDNTDPGIDPGEDLDSTFGNSYPIKSSDSIPITELAHTTGAIEFRRELRAQIRPWFTRPGASALIWRRGVTYSEPVPNWREANQLTDTIQWEPTTFNFFFDPDPISFPDRFWVSDKILGYEYDEVEDVNYLAVNARPVTSQSMINQRVDQADGFFNAGRSWLSPHHVDDVIEPYKANYPIIIHLGSYPANRESNFMIGFGNTAISEVKNNIYSYRVEGTNSDDGAFLDFYENEVLGSAEGVTRQTETSNIDGIIPFYYYVGTFKPTAAGVYTNEITVKYKDGITDNLKQDGALRELEYPVLIVAEAVEDPPEIVVDIQNYIVTPQEGAEPLEALDGAPVSLTLEENDVFNANEEDFLKFEFVKNGNITPESPYQKKKIIFRNTSTTSSVEYFFFLRKDTNFFYYDSTKNLPTAGVYMDTSDCDPHFEVDFVHGLPLAPAGMPGDSCEITIIYKPDLSDTEFTQYIQTGYEIKPNQFSHRGLTVSFKPIDPANLKTELDKNSFRNLSGNLVPNASTLEVGSVTMTDSVITKSFHDVRVFNVSDTPASFLNEYHNYLKENNLKGFNNTSSPPIDFLPPPEDYELRGSHNVTLMKRITYPDGSDRFLIYGSQECFIGDDEFPEPEKHYLEGFHSSSSDCYLSIEASFNKDYIARRINFGDGATTDGSYFSLTYYNNERLSISNTPMYFVINGTFNPDRSTANGDIFNVDANYNSKSIQFDFNPMIPNNTPMGEITGYRVFYSTSKNRVANVLYTNIVPDYIDIRVDLTNPSLTLTGLDAATFYYFKIYPIREYTPREDSFLNPSFENLAQGEYLSISNLGTHKIVVPSETTSFNYANQMLIRKSYVSATRVTFSDAIINCGISSDTFKKDGVSSLLSFKLVNQDVWDVIVANPLYTNYSSGSIESIPHWIDTAPINVDTAFSGVTGYDSEEVSQAFSSDLLFYLRNESNFNGAVQKLEGGGPSPVSTNYTNYVTPGIPFGVARCFIDTSN